MKITFFAPQLPKDGIATYTNYLTRGLNQNGVETEIIPLEPDKLTPAYLSQAARQLGQKELVHIQHEFGMWRDWKNPFNRLLKNFLNEIKIPKVITVHSFHPWLVKFPSYKNRSSLKEISKKIVRAFLTNNPWGKETFGGVFKFAGKVIVHTHFHKAHLINTGVLESQIEVIPHGVLNYNVQGKGDKFRQKYQLKGERVLSIFGFWDPSKGYEVALETLRQLPEEFVLVIAGGPRTKAQEEYFENVKLKIKNEKLDKRIRITGFLPEEEIADVMAATDLVLVPQIYATGSGSVMHALGNRKAIIASDLPFFREINERVSCLALFPAGSSAALARTILELTKNAAGIQELEKRAGEYAAKFNWSEIAKSHRNLYADLVQRSD